jgi:hypothetical protein
MSTAIAGGEMNRREFILVSSAAVGLVVLAACGGGAPSEGGGEKEGQPAVQPRVIDVNFGAKGGLGTGGAFVTQEGWEPKRVDVPVGQPFKLRFVPTDQRFHVIVSNLLGLELEVKDGQPAESPVLTIKEVDKLIDIFCREHRGAGGFGSILGTKS